MSIDIEGVNSIVVLINPAAGNGKAHKSWGHLRAHFEECFGAITGEGAASEAQGGHGGVLIDTSGRSSAGDGEGAAPEAQGGPPATTMPFTGNVSAAAAPRINVIETQSRQHAIELGATLDCGLIISVSGDGAVHDIAQGVLARPRAERPALTVIPVGSGNDYAKALGIPQDPYHAITVLGQGHLRTVDAGRCNSNFFLNTLSFGIDAAIAAKTHELRKSTGSSGFYLYAHAAIISIMRELHTHHLRLELDGQVREEDVLICAVQNGPTYGGGFRIAPQADISDGRFDVCYALDASIPKALYALTRIARGTHENLDIVRTATAANITLDFKHEVPAQCDGEPLSASHFEVEMLPQALEALVP
ncbi:MAG: diacylglycerol kinase family lipid kinase [Coriobacteriales bacterium]|jgi:YegS/Rv2252/BmrU family lipid kinase|nr:diacylglycerol kinase family lipid kinase [Coriobacteriales bacterium]